MRTTVSDGLAAPLDPVPALRPCPGADAVRRAQPRRARRRTTPADRGRRPSRPGGHRRGPARRRPSSCWTWPGGRGPLGGLAARRRRRPARSPRRRQRRWRWPTAPGSRTTRRRGADGCKRGRRTATSSRSTGCRSTTPVRTAADLACRRGRLDAMAVLDAFARVHGVGAAAHRASARAVRRPPWRHPVPRAGASAGCSGGVAARVLDAAECPRRRDCPALEPQVAHLRAGGWVGPTRPRRPGAAHLRRVRRSGLPRHAASSQEHDERRRRAAARRRVGGRRRARRRLRRAGAEPMDRRAPVGFRRARRHGQTALGARRGSRPPPATFLSGRRICARGTQNPRPRHAEPALSARKTRALGTQRLALSAVRRAGPGDRVEGDGGGDTGVEGLDRARHRDGDELVAGLGDQAREATALGADDDHEGAVGEVEVGQGDVSVGGEADDHAARLTGTP